MSNGIIGGITLAIKRWKQTTGIAIIFIFVSITLTLVLTDVITQFQTLRAGKALREHNAVIFSPTYLQGGVTDASDSAMSFLQDTLLNNVAYSSVLNNLSVEDDNPFDGIKTILVTGRQAHEYFDYLAFDRADSYVLRGSQVQGASSVNFHNMLLPVVGTIPLDSIWFDPNAAGLNLDNTQIIVLAPSDIKLLDNYEKEELLVRSVFLSPTAETVSQFVENAREGGLYLVPANLAKEQPDRFSDLMVQAALYVIALAAFLILACIGYANYVSDIIRNEMRAFMIRKMCGATTSQLVIRFLSFLAVTIAIGPLIICSLLSSAGPPFSTSALFIAWSVILIYVIFSLLAIRTIRKGVPTRL